MNMKPLLIGMFFGLIAQVLTFFQLQGQLKYEWFKTHYWAIVLMGIPISMAFMYSVENIIIAFSGQMWPSRLIGFSIGAISFAVLSYIIFNEPITAKTLICLALASMILLIQLFYK